MSTVATAIGVISILLVIAVIVIISIVYKKKTGTFQTFVIDKKVSNTIIYSGILVPVIYYVLIVGMGIEIRVNKLQYDNIQIGDSIQVSRYSNGSYGLEY